MKCAALDWDKTREDYVPCDTSTPKMVRLIALITVDVPLCNIHKELFETSLAQFGGSLDRVKRVIEITPAS